MAVYYNDSEPFVCDWLRNLIRGKLLPEGEVDPRPIQEVSAADVRGFTQCHFFAGIGGWALALQLAGLGWGDGPVWTGSCPCQPFSAAGKGKAEDDPRHLWPHWFRLIRESRPQRVFGEQVANGVGKGWLDLVSTDLEAEGYAVGAVVLGAHSVGGYHIRQRLWFVADAGRAGAARLREHGGTDSGPEVEGSGLRSRVGDAGGERRDGQQVRLRIRGPLKACPEIARTGCLNSFWADADWLYCRDGKRRPVEPGTFPLAHGIPGRVGRLRAYGNAIVPEVAAAFVSAYLATQRGKR